MNNKQKNKTDKMYELGFLIASIIGVVEKACLNDDRHEEATILHYAYQRQFDLLDYILDDDNSMSVF
ncbi:hypothetical protein IKP85_03755 [bacterium]|nr:hypothetical protein [bacterium]